MLGTLEIFTPESLQPMKLLVETGLVDDHGVDGLLDVVKHVDGDVVDERVVVVLVENPEVVTNLQEVVEDRQESCRKKVENLSSCWLGLLLW